MNFTTKMKAAAVAMGAGLALASMLLLAAPPQASATVAGDAGATFMAKCAACHGKDGSGNTAAGKGMGVKDLRSAEVQGQSDAQLAAVIGKGKGKMPGYEKTLGADAVKGLVAYVRSLKR
jgi:mono/diheme cytochrome c family protein